MRGSRPDGLLSETLSQNAKLYIGSRSGGSRQERSSLSLVSKSHSVKLEMTKAL